MASKEQQHPFYKPLWVRVAILVTIALWLAFEIYMESSGLWIALAIGMLGYAAYTFFLTWPKDGPGNTPEDDGRPPA